MRGHDATECHEVRMAKSFAKVIDEMSDESITIVTVCGACASLLTTYFSDLKPADRVLLLSQTVDAIISGDRAHHDRDLRPH